MDVQDEDNYSGLTRVGAGATSVHRVEGSSCKNAGYTLHVLKANAENSSSPRGTPSRRFPAMRQ